MNITAKQWVQIVQGIIGGLVTGAALMQTLMGQDLTIKIVAGLGILNIIVSAIAAPFTGQGATIKEVAAMPGVERVSINATANQTVAAIAIDPAQQKVGATDPQTREVLKDTAKGA
jgi:hypothetical protein